VHPGAIEPVQYSGLQELVENGRGTVERVIGIVTLEIILHGALPMVAAQNHPSRDPGLGDISNVLEFGHPEGPIRHDDKEAGIETAGIQDELVAVKPDVFAYGSITTRIIALVRSWVSQRVLPEPLAVDARHGVACIFGHIPVQLKHLVRHVPLFSA